MLHNSPEGTEINPHFGKWKALPHFPNDMNAYCAIIDTTRRIMYYRPTIKQEGLVRTADHFVDPQGKEVRLSAVLLFYSDMVYIHAETEQGNYLIAVPERFAKDTTTIVAQTYKAIVRYTHPPTRPITAADRQIHWVWFRRTPTWRLTEEIVLRAASWIELNPGYRFNLWTNLRDAEELADFLADLPADLRIRYFDRVITVRFAAEFRATVFGWLEEHASAHTEEVFDAVWDSTEPQDMLLKTDFSRNILLTVHGGIYADFNDVICLAPIEPLLEAHAGNYVGVSDSSQLGHASNYFMYAAADNAEWTDIVLRSMETLPEICRGIHRTRALRSARDILRSGLDGSQIDMERVREALRVSPLGIPSITEPHYLQALCLALGIVFEETPLADVFADFIQTIIKKPGRRGKKLTVSAELAALLQKHQEQIAPLLQESDPLFGPAWRLALMDMYLYPVMYRSNLPLFCRERGYPIWLVPFGNLMRYGCMLSFVGHLADGTSYGMDSGRDISIRYLTGK
jgi:hypothetical protein